MEKDPYVSINEIIKENFKDYSTVNVLEVGCGSMCHIDTGHHFKITGIDISQKQLDRNKILSEKILGDIHTYPLPKQKFDLVICWDVLEHLENPEKAIKNFLQALRLNGLIVLAAPNIGSLKGIATKLTPTIVHVWFYKYILKSKLSFRDDEGPFPTYFKSIIYPGKIKKFAASNGLENVFFRYVTAPFVKQIKTTTPIAYLLHTLAGKVASVLTFGKVSEKNTDYLLMLKKRSN